MRQAEIALARRQPLRSNTHLNRAATHHSGAPVQPCPKERHVIHIAPAIPLLRIFSEEKAREFYIDYLGFAIDWEHRFHENMPLYMQIRRDDLVLHLTEHHGDTTPASTVFIPLHGIETLHAELLAKPYRFLRPGVETVDWGRELTVTDPFGNRLRFCEQSHG